MNEAEGLINQIVALLQQAGRGMRQAEIARRLAAHPQAVSRAVTGAQQQGILLDEDDEGRVGLMQKQVY